MLSKHINNSIQQALFEIVQSGDFRVYVGEGGKQLAELLSASMEGAECLLVSSATAGLEIVLRTAGIGPGDEVLISAYDYPGNFWAIERVGAIPVLIDTEKDSWRISRCQLEDLFRKSRANACKAVVASHLHGQLQDAVWLREFSERQGLLFVEDSCQAIGATLDNRSAGCFGHATILSFGGGKLISAGRGGALLTADRRLAQKAKLAAGAGSGPYAMSEVQAAMVKSQVGWLPDLNDCCRTFFGQVDYFLREGLGEHVISIVMPAREHLSHTSFYQAGWLIGRLASQAEAASANPPRDQSSDLARLVGALKAAQIPAGSGFEGFHRRSSRRCRTPFSLDQVRRVVERTLVIHHRVALDEYHTPASLAAKLIAEILHAE